MSPSVVDDILRLRDEYNNADEAGKRLMDQRYGRRAMKQILEESYSQDWLNEYSKCCPHCNTYIQVSKKKIGLLY